VKFPMIEHQHPKLRVSTRLNAATWLLIGAMGAGMRAFADMLLDAGESVVGTDLELTTDGSGNSPSAESGRFKSIHKIVLIRFSQHRRITLFTPLQYQIPAHCFSICINSA
jgi:hypothetical protein